jgi:nucleotide-binding universal stress UspA family protein
MYRLIRIPLDGSALAEQALPLAARLAQRDAAAMQVVHVYEPLTPIYRTLEAALELDLKNGMRDYLDATVKDLAEKLDFRAEPVLLNGPPAETLAGHASDSGADLLVMATQGRGPLGRMWFGSVADALVRQSPIPILFVRPNETSSEPHSGPVRHVLVPLDGSELAEGALEPALALCGDQGHVTLLRVIPAVYSIGAGRPNRRMSELGVTLLQQLEELTHQQMAEANEYLGKVADRLRARSVSTQIEVVAHDQPAFAILDAAAKHGADAIAMTTRGQSGFKRLSLGSVANKAVRGATMPVLICPSAESASISHERN